MRNISIALCMASVATGATFAAESAHPRAPAWTSLEELHADYVRAFVHSDGFGIRRVTPMMRLMQEGSLLLNGQQLRVEDVQMIGIARHDPPVVFAGGFLKFQHGDEHVPFLLDDAQRPLDAQERRVLDKLRAGQQVLASAMPGGPAIGAIRAEHSCLQCHRAEQEGDLLGAFVYTFGPLTH